MNNQHLAADFVGNKGSRGCFCPSCLPLSRDVNNDSLVPGISRKVVYTDETASVVANQMNQMTLKERERVYEDIHGVSDVISEEPLFVAQSLEQMEDEIGKIRKKTAYERALFLSPPYVQDRDFRLMFLRCELFDAEKAAQRFVRFFDYKLDLFGPDRLMKDITLGDLDADDMDCLMNGSHFFLKEKDRGGRTIMFVSQGNQRYKGFVNLMRMCFYQNMATLEQDEETQKNGFVVIIYNVGVGQVAMKLDWEVYTSATSFIDCLPIRINSMHYCFDNSNLRPVLSFVQLACGDHTRVRFRAHCGSHIECQYSLAGFGITRDMLPLDKDDKYDYQKFLQFVEQRRRIEAESAARNTGQIHFPLSNDVLLGRGRPYQEFTGNARLSAVIDKHGDAYFQGNRSEKTALSSEIVRTIKDMNGRFLKRDENGRGWVTVPDEVGRLKISHSFRTKKRLNSPNLVQQHALHGGHESDSKRAKSDTVLF